MVAAITPSSVNMRKLLFESQAMPCPAACGGRLRTVNAGDCLERSARDKRRRVAGEFADVADAVVADVEPAGGRAAPRPATVQVAEEEHSRAVLRRGNTVVTMCHVLNS
jgi:hypothetical protein